MIMCTSSPPLGGNERASSANIISKSTCGSVRMEPGATSSPGKLQGNGLAHPRPALGSPQRPSGPLGQPYPGTYRLLGVEYSFTI